ncbi:MAG: hypothetical protein KBG40_03890 [Bacteroidales bacterium]|nr:hypothetical protein [Bacteroidales bacterium]
MSVILAFVPLLIFSQQEKINVIVIGAHPDDCDGRAGGTAILSFKRPGLIFLKTLSDSLHEINVNIIKVIQQSVICFLI